MPESVKLQLQLGKAKYVAEIFVYNSKGFENVVKYDENVPLS